MEHVHAFQCSEEIMDEAYAWVLTFNGDTPVSKEETAALREWVRRSPVHKEALKEAEDFWCEAELLSALAVPMQKKWRGWLGGFFSADVGLLSTHGGAGSLVFSRAATFASVLFVGAVLVVWQLMPISGSVGNGLYRTAVGEQTTLTLRDASQILLDTNSEVRIAYEDGVRKIHLLHGKAHFDVAKKLERPFEVYARKGLVTAVGTAFSVYLSDNNIEVLVDEGRVDLTRISKEGHGAPQKVEQSNSEKGDGTAISNASLSSPSSESQAITGKVFLSLEHGQGAQFNQEQQVLLEFSEKDLANASSWRNGTLTFTRDPLSKVVSEMGRYTNTTIEITSPELRDLKMGGRFKVGELGALFEVLEIGFGVEAHYVNDHHVKLSLVLNE